MRLKRFRSAVDLAQRRSIPARLKRLWEKHIEISGEPMIEVPEISRCLIYHSLRLAYAPTKIFGGLGSR